MFGLFRRAVTVSFVDDATGERIAWTEQPLAQLPDTFELETEVTLGEQRFVVVRAEPKTKSEFSRTKCLIITVRKVEQVDPTQVLFSLPSICGAALPEACSISPGAHPLPLHEDSWRQCEFVSQVYLSEVSAELADIGSIHSRERVKGGGWRSIHVRERIAAPLAPPRLRLHWREIRALLENSGTFAPIEGVSFAQGTVVLGSVGAYLDGSVVLWGVERQSGLEALCVEHVEEASPDAVAALKRVADTFGLLLVDWCWCRAYSPGGGSVDGAAGAPWRKKRERHRRRVAR